MLEQLWLKINDVCKHPLSAILSIVFVAAWFILSFYTNGGTLFQNGHFDPGMTIGGFITNAIQLVLLFVGIIIAGLSYANSSEALHHAKEAHRHAKEHNERNLAEANEIS